LTIDPYPNQQNQQEITRLRREKEAILEEMRAQADADAAAAAESA
jgi:hypothetical protein